MNLTFELNKISKYRTPLMGISAILIILCHANLYDIAVGINVKKLLSLGNVGVDIFLFLSGIGCYYSLNRGGGDLLKWYKKRFLRIFIPYTLAQIPFWGFYIIYGDFDLADSLYEYSTLAFWIRHTGMWYIALLIPLYFVTPFLYMLFEKTKRRLRLAVFLMLVVLILCNVEIIIYNRLAMEIISNIQWALVRTVTFILGIALAPAVKENIKVNGIYIILGTLLLIGILRLFGIGYYWCLFAVMILFFIYFIELLEYKGKAILFFNFMGIISLESYLFNGYVRYVFMDLPIYTSKSILFYGHYIDYFLIFIVGTILSYLINKISTYIFRKVDL